MGSLSDGRVAPVLLRCSSAPGAVLPVLRPDKAAKAKEGTPACSTTTVLTGTLLGVLAARCGKLAVRRGRKHRLQHASFTAQFAARRGANSSVAAPPPQLEVTLAEACKGCLQTLGKHSSLVPSPTSPRWSIEEEEDIADGAVRYSRFRIDKVPARQGRTLGNTLRRTLLRQDLFRSYAAVAFRVRHRSFNTSSSASVEGRLFLSRGEPALHEFASVPGVRESMIDVVRNVQQLAVAQADWKAPDDLPITGLASNSGEPDSWRWTSRRCGPCVLQAGDLDMVDSSTHFEVPVMLPLADQHLLQVTAPAMVELDVEATCCSQQEWDDSPAFEKYRQRLRFDGWLIVPPLFSPVKKVNYLITNSDSGPDEVVQLEVWTTRAADPAELVCISASTLLGGLMARAAGEQDAMRVDPAASVDDEATPPLAQTSEVSAETDESVAWEEVLKGRRIREAAEKLKGEGIEGDEEDFDMQRDGFSDILESAIHDPDSLLDGSDVPGLHVDGLLDNS
eukprot:TRINITY_DN32339_c0_g1_i1.p1 TRINITY_DN32339_c0_g1~~TRINITY_DN32339_c0_g1_i1.p1  ORF type:complete len:518 (-),score=119.89 TRINITY_DN32339_c0_g1_i1:23-1543(-)